MQNEQPFTMMERARIGYAVGQAVGRTCAISMEVFLHKQFGKHYLSWQSFAVYLVLWLFGLVWAHDGHDCRPLVAYTMAYTLALLWAGFSTLWRNRHGQLEHSLYNGVPRLFPSSTPRREQWSKELFEPALVIGLGLYIAQYVNPPLGMWLVLGGVCLSGTNRQFRQHQRQCATEMQDALIEQQWRAHQARDLQRRLGM